MDDLVYRENELCFSGVSLTQLAQQYQTPTYVYSRAAIERQWHAFDSALSPHPHRICYAVKANSNLAVLQVLAAMGSGFDVVSQGELERVLAVNGDPAAVVFSGVAKSVDEIDRALSVGIGCFNVESRAELERIADRASRQQTTARIAFRVNPNVDAKTHPYISTGLKENKFGVDYDEAMALYLLAATLPSIQIVGAACHIGSQITTLSPFMDALDRMLVLVDQLAASGIVLEHLDLGGGLGVCYDDETPLDPDEYARAIKEKMQSRQLSIILEPGRAIVANAGVLLTRVEYLKHHESKQFAIVDAGMNDLLRPALYDAYHGIIPARLGSTSPLMSYDVVGPVCETSDFIGKDRMLALSANDLLVVKSAGAYGASMGSHYNTRRAAVELMIQGSTVHCIREREAYTALFSAERCLPEVVPS